MSYSSALNALTNEKCSYLSPKRQIYKKSLAPPSITQGPVWRTAPKISVYKKKKVTKKKKMSLVVSGCWRYWVLSKMDVQQSVAKLNSSNILMQSVLTSLIGFTADAHLRGVRQSMSNTPCLSLLLCSSSCALGEKPDFFKTPPHQVLDASKHTHTQVELSSLGNDGHCVCVCVRESERESVCVCWPTFTQWERGRAVKVSPPSFLCATSSNSLCPGILRMQQWLWQRCSSE